jgi:hypothetical protein
MVKAKVKNDVSTDDLEAAYIAKLQTQEATAQSSIHSKQPPGQPPSRGHAAPAVAHGRWNAAPQQQQHNEYSPSRSERRGGGGSENGRISMGGGGSVCDTARYHHDQQPTHHHHHREPALYSPPELKFAGHYSDGGNADDDDEIGGRVNVGKGWWRQFVNVATAVKDEVKHMSRGPDKEANLSLTIPPAAAQEIDRHLRHRAKELVNSTASDLDEGAIRMHLDQGVATITQAAERKSIALRDNCVGLEVKRLQSEHGALVIFEQRGFGAKGAN